MSDELRGVPRKYRDICPEMKSFLDAGITLFPDRQIQDGSVAVYSLFDPRNCQCRYIGYTKNFGLRYSAHLHQLSGGTHKTNWLTALLAEQYLPIMMQVSPEVTPDRGRSNEISLIRSFREIGFPLTNGTDGGEGNPGFVVTEEFRRKVSQGARKEKVTRKKDRVLTRHTEESVAKIVRANAGESNHQAKLNAGQVAEMRKLMDDGVPNIDVARRYGISATQISRIRRNISWAV